MKLGAKIAVRVPYNVKRKIVGVARRRKIDLADVVREALDRHLTAELAAQPANGQGKVVAA